MEKMPGHAIETKEAPPEFVDLVNEHNEPLSGKAVSRDQAHAEGLWHRTVHICVTRRSDGGLEVLVHKRSRDKKQYPGTFDPVFGGHIKSGESEKDTALAELQEEIGILPDEGKLVFHGFIKKDDEVKAPNDREFNMLFTYELSPEEEARIQLQTEEVESVQWMPLPELVERIRASEASWRPSVEEMSASLETISFDGYAAREA